MKKRISVLIALVLIIVVSASVGLVGCNNDDNTQQAPSEYVIQYTDDDGTHQITVKSGDVYSIESIPTKTGHDFIGLYDAKVGGTQYVDEHGVALSPFADNKNLILFPQFKANEYKVILNYGDSPVTSVREISVEYDSELPELPVNLTAENKDFKGWYTEPNCGGTQIADTFGVLPDRRLITEQNFDLTNANGYIYLYAGFRGAMRTVTFYGESGSAPIEMQIEHGTSIGNIVPDYRTEEGFGVLEWTQDSNPTESSLVFKGEIVGNMTLYAKTYAPVIEFDTNGGEEIIPLVQTASKNITLPTPVRINYKFLYWADASGKEVTYSVMPSASIELTAVWQPLIILEENGGTLVDDIAKNCGEEISLPQISREGYSFAGWFNKENVCVELSLMPEEGMVLTAKWYKNITVSKVKLSVGDEYEILNAGTFWTLDVSEMCGGIDFSNGIYVDVKLEFKSLQYRPWGNVIGPFWYELYVGIYEEPDLNAQFLMSKKEYYPHNNVTVYQSRVFEDQVYINTNIIYVGFNSVGETVVKAKITEFTVYLSYPDMSRLF